MENRIIVISGFSASGKDKICKYISDNLNYEMIKSTTTRPIRPNESEGNPYHFVTREQFEDMISKDEFIEYRTYNTLVGGIPDTWYYGVHKDSVDLSRKSYVVVLDLLGTMEFKKHFGKKVKSFFIDVNEPERRRRAFQGRKDFDLTEWNRRYLDDLKQFPMDKVRQEVDYIVNNYDFYECMREIGRLI